MRHDIFGGGCEEMLNDMEVRRVQVSGAPSHASANQYSIGAPYFTRKYTSKS
jgi:hypothetical protein